MRALLVATAGGHLTQLMTLSQRLPFVLDDTTWVTMATAQSRSLLAGRDVVWAEYGAPRDLKALAGHFALAQRTVKNFDVVISTGANLAPPFLAVARTRRIASHYIESATRVSGPSMAGRLAERIPGVHLYSQYESWAGGRWQYGGSVFDGWSTDPGDPIERGPIRRVLVTVGSARDFPFPRLLEAAGRVISPDAEIIWQVGAGAPPGLSGEVVADLPAKRMAAELAAADVVIGHAGTGSAIAALQAGRCPVIVARSAAAGEHVDDHQGQIAGMLGGRGLAVVRTPDELTTADLVEAASRRVTTSNPGPFRLAG